MIPPAPVAEPAPAVRTWSVRGRRLALDRPRVLGILNVTPDSFSDGGRFFDSSAAIAHAEQMAAQGAEIIDIGGESTRPQGARPVDAAEESRRVIPIVRELSKRLPHTLISVDTVKADVAERAIAEGAHIINDVSGFRLDARMAAVCAGANAGVVLMHSRGTVSTMATYEHAEYGPDPVGEVVAELRQSVAGARAAGIGDEAIVLDPGIGFSKRSEHSVALLAHLERIVDLGFPVLVGVSRKRFIGEITGVPSAPERLHGTIGANVIALARGATLFRVHDVAPNRQALDVAWRVLHGSFR